MMIDELWAAMETDAALGPSGASGWTLRLARGAPDCPIFVALEIGTLRRAVVLRLAATALPPEQSWPRAKGLDPVVIPSTTDVFFGVQLKDARFADVFTALAEDLARRVRMTSDAHSLSRAFLGRLLRWQRFLSVGSDGLSLESQQGLWGELHFLREQLIPLLGSLAPATWKGPEGAHQDFQYGSCAIEVKTSLASQPQKVRISSARQLDSSTWGALFLTVVSVEARDGAGTTLPTMIESIRSLLAQDPLGLESLEDCLLQAGYLDAHASRYHRGYVARALQAFRVDGSFPCISERSLPNGVTELSYSLDLTACMNFKVDMTAFRSVLLESNCSQSGEANRG